MAAGRDDRQDTEARLNDVSVNNNGINMDNNHCMEEASRRFKSAGS